jgi:hypothetical protein
METAAYVKEMNEGPAENKSETVMSKAKTIVGKYATRGNIFKAIGIASLIGVIGFSGKYMPLMKSGFRQTV